ncbi:MAG TPA: hypothetical protein VK338_03985, partial [Candidatus Nitrosocosmicus sp.]|nr:hypothetical protein [Candidatus Nitrosocosmicus sp.]
EPSIYRLIDFMQDKETLDSVFYSIFSAHQLMLNAKKMNGLKNAIEQRMKSTKNCNSLVKKALDETVPGITSEIVNNFDLSEFPYKDFNFQDISKFHVPLKPQEVDRIDDHINGSDVGNNKDIFAIAFLARMARISNFQNSEDIQVFRKIDITKDTLAQFNKIRAVMGAYCDVHEDTIISQLNYSSETPEHIKEYSPMIAAFIGFDITQWLENAHPSNYQQLLEDNFIPGLEPNLIPILINIYLSNNKKEFEALLSLRDKQGYRPYQQLDISAANGSCKQYLDTLLEPYDLTEDDDKPTASIVKFKKHYKRIIKCLGDSIHTLSIEDEKISHIYLASHNTKNFVDILISSPDGAMTSIQIDDRGNVLGLPLHSDKNTHQFLEDILRKVLPYFQEKGAVPTDKKPEPEVIVYNYPEPKIAIDQPNLKPIKYNETRTVEPHIPRKRRAMRRLGLIKDTQRNTTNENEQETQFEISTSDYCIIIPEEIISKYSKEIQDQIREAVRLVEQDIQSQGYSTRLVKLDEKRYGKNKRRIRAGDIRLFVDISDPKEGKVILDQRRKNNTYKSPNLAKSIRKH